jgi:enoyl-CoA hydratase/carnithine racemase
LEPYGAELLVIRLDRPEKRNALSLALIEQLTESLQQADRGAAIRGVILAGAGSSFSAGVDLHEFAEATPDTAGVLITGLRQLCSAVRKHSKPVVCAIQGHCLGGALELAACCDLRVCAPDARLGMPEVVIGIPSVIDAVMLGYLVGTGRARELVLTGETISGETAYSWGLVNRLAPAADVVQAAAELLGLVTRHAPDAIATQKRLNQMWLDVPYEKAVEASIDNLVDAFRTGRPQLIATEWLLRRHKGPSGAHCLR